MGNGVQKCLSFFPPGSSCTNLYLRRWLFYSLPCFALQTCLSFRTRTHAFKAQSRPWQLTGVSFHSNSRLAEQERMLTPFKVFRVSSTRVSTEESATFCALSTATSLSSLPTLQSPYVDVGSYMLAQLLLLV